MADNTEGASRTNQRNGSEDPPLRARGVGRLEIRPALNDLAVGNAPNDDAGEFQTLVGGGVGASPMVADDDFIVFGDEVFDGDVKVRNFFEGGADVLDGSLRAGREAGRDVGAVIHEAGGEIDFADLEIFAVDEFFEMIADEVFHFGVRHVSFWIFDFRLLRRRAHARSPSLRNCSAGV